MDIIVPAAGFSRRFPNLRPKYSLTDYKGRIMLYSSIKSYLGKYKIHVGILREHEEKYKITDILRYEFQDQINIVILENPTCGPADTVYQILQKLPEIKGEIFVKDCDSFFEHDNLNGNYVCVSSFSDNQIVRKPQSKSYVIKNDQNMLQNIVEKKVVSENFCVGGYKFVSAKNFIDAYNSLHTYDDEIFVSNIIQFCISQNEIFQVNFVKNYVDVGTVEEWNNFNNKYVIFCDIDGTLVKAQNKGSYHKKPIPLDGNIGVIKKLINEDNQILFVTSRPENARKDTLHMLEELGFSQPNLIMGLLNCQRILINDYNDANPYPRSIAVNVKRDSDHLKDFLI